jgi:hypothetical protein
MSSFLSRSYTIYFNILCHYTYSPRWHGRRKNGILRDTFYDAVSASNIIWRRTVGLLVGFKRSYGRIENDIIKITSGDFPGGTGNITKPHSQDTPGSLRSELGYLANTSLDFYRYIKPYNQVPLQTPLHFLTLNVIFTSKCTGKILGTILRIFWRVLANRHM